MDNLRAAAFTQGLPASSNDSAATRLLTNHDRQALASDLAQLLAHEPASAAEVVRDLLASAPMADGAEIGAAIAANLDPPALKALAQTPVGRDLLDALVQHVSQCLSLPDQQRHIGRVREALQGGAQGPAVTARSLTELALQPVRLNVASSTNTPADNSAAAKEQIQSAFKAEFAAKASDKESFHALMRDVFGDKYDKNLAEQYRQRALAGDFAFLPDVKLVDAGTLRGANGAYNTQEGVVYINRELALADPSKAAQTFVEEAGHHLDARLNTADTQGDEGEMFRRVLGGEQLSAQQIAAIRDENDKGAITVDGRKVEVEFWFGEDLWEGAKDVVTSAVDKGKEVVSDVADHVGTAARDVAYSVGDMVKEGTMGLVDGAGMFVMGVAKGFGGWAVNIMEGRFADAWDSAVNGLDKALIQAPRRIFNGALESAGHFLKTPTYLLPKKFGGSVLRSLADRGIDNMRSIGNGAIDIARNFIRLPLEIHGAIVRDFGEALRHWARGDIGEGFKRAGLAFVEPIRRGTGAVVDSAMIFGQGVGNVFGNSFGIHEPSRALSDPEREYLRKVYGDSLNLADIRIHKGNLTTSVLGMAPHTVGNDIYLPDEGPENCFNADGSLNEKGLQTLMHEAAHVYQAQHGGNGYIHEALLANAEGMVDSGNRNQGYDWTVPFRAGKPFNEWNPEAQAKFLETMGKARQGMFDSNGDGVADTSYDLNRNGVVDQNEFELAWSDREWRAPTADGSAVVIPPDGKITDARRAGTTTDPEPARLNLSPDDFRRLIGIWESARADVPHRTVL